MSEHKPKFQKGQTVEVIGVNTPANKFYIGSVGIISNIKFGIVGHNGICHNVCYNIFVPDLYEQRQIQAQHANNNGYGYVLGKYDEYFLFLKEEHLKLICSNTEKGLTILKKYDYE